MRRQHIRITLATVCRSTNIDSQLGAVRTPRRFDVAMRIPDVASLSLAIVILTSAVFVPCRRLETIAVVFREIHFSTAAPTARTT